MPKVFVLGCHASNSYKSKKAYIIDEELLKPCMRNICTELFGNKYVTKIKNIPISIVNITRKMHFIIDDIENQVLQRSKTSI